MTTGLLITLGGKNSIAADLGGGYNLVLTHVAFGDANGVPYTPVETQVALVNERYRATIASVAVLNGEIIVDAIIPADTNDANNRPSHGFAIAECGLYSSDGVMIGVARMGNGFKPSPASGQASIATFRLKLAVANPSAITVVIDPQSQIAIGRQVRPFWLAVNGVLNAPPVAPATGDTYIIDSAPTGAWAGFAGRLAQWIGVWALATVPEGHIVADTSKAITDLSRHLTYSGGSWISWTALTSMLGPVRLATLEEAASGIDNGKAITCAGVRRAVFKRTRQAITTVGTTNWVVPTGVTTVRTGGWGGAGGGGFGAAGSPGGAAAGGGAGAYCEKTFEVTPGQIITFVIGAGGAAGISGTPGQAGGNTTITYAGVTITAGGGQGGQNAAANSGSGSVSGGFATGPFDIGAPGEPSKGSFLGGGQSFTVWYAGAGGSSPYGGGLGGGAGSGGGNNGIAPGGGGAGSGGGQTSGAGGRGEGWVEF
jgi:Phage tail-collar fibre protein/Protein of unknown function (DUF2793)